MKETYRESREYLVFSDNSFAMISHLNLMSLTDTWCTPIYMDTRDENFYYGESHEEQLDQLMDKVRLSKNSKAHLIKMFKLMESNREMIWDQWKKCSNKAKESYKSGVSKIKIKIDFEKDMEEVLWIGYFDESREVNL